MYYLVMKRCCRCQQTKDLVDFHRSRLRADGVQTVCKACRTHLDSERYRTARAAGVLWKRSNPKKDSTQAWIVSLKTGHACTDCGRVFPPAAMQWDHLPGTTKVADVSGLRNRTREAILAEIAKCELVCVNCHTIRTVRRAGWAQPRRLVQDAASQYLVQEM